MQHARMIVVMGLLALGMLAGAPDALAQNTPTAPVTGNLNNQKGCSDYVGLSNRIVMCIRETVDHAASIYFGKDTDGDGRIDTGFFGAVKSIVTGFFTLTVIIYGILAMYGMLEKPGRDIMLLMVKLSLVMGFVVKSDWMYDTILTAMDAAGSAVVQFSPQSGEIVDGFGADRLTCVNNMRKAADTRVQGERREGPNYSAAWLGMDCILDTVIGIKVAPEAYGGPSINGATATKGLQEYTVNPKLDDKNKGMARGLINFFFSNMQTSIMGILLAVMGFVFIYSLLWMVLKGLFVYLAGYIAIAFMMIFAPLFIPLVLFRVTSEYFKKWLKLTISFAMQPVIILAFVTFAVSAIDYAMFSGDYSLMYRIAGDASRKQPFNLNEYMEQHKLIKTKNSVLAEGKTSVETPTLNKDSVASGVEQVKGMFGQLSTSNCGEQMQKLGLNTDPKEIEKIRSSCSGYAFQWWKKNVDWDAMAKARTPAVRATQPEEGDEEAGIKTPEERAARTIAREVFSATIFAAVVVLCINGLMSLIPSVVNDLVGDAFQSPNLFNEVSRANGSTGITSRIASAFQPRKGSS